jgi:hypothetical protein
MRLCSRAAIVAGGACVVMSWAAVVSPAGASQIVEFEKEAAVAANSPIPPVPAKPLEEAKEACGSETTTWGSELLTTAPSEIKVKNEWGDIVPGKEVMVSGTIHNLVSPGDADIPIDHPFSADTTFDVMLDEPYWSLARELTAESEGKPSAHELHMELETGAFPHVVPQKEGPAEGEPWGLLEEEVTRREEHGESTATLVDDASVGLQSGYIPHNGDRIAMRGRWIIDCGHADFHAELHPITFMAFGHEEGAKTVVHVLANPYRVTQLYGLGTIELNPMVARGKPFPEGFEHAVSQLVKLSLFRSGPSPLALLGGLERTLPSTVPFQVCAPEGGVRAALSSFSFVKRGGVTIETKRPTARGQCATFKATVNPEKYKVLEPRPRTCEMPWPWLSQRIAESLGVSGVRSNEVERITVNATGGTFTISYGGETTGPINYNASATEVQEALNALPVLKPGDITVIGGPGGKGGAPYTLIFGGTLAEQGVTPVTTDRSGLTGGPKLATVVVLRPGGPLDLRRFILSEIEQQQKASLEEAGFFAGIARIEANMALNPQASCLDPLSAPALNPEKTQTQNNGQPFPYYGEVTLERR